MKVLVLVGLVSRGPSLSHATFLKRYYRSKRRQSANPLDPGVLRSGRRKNEKTFSFFLTGGIAVPQNRALLRVIHADREA